MGRRRHERELHHPALGVLAALLELRLDRPQRLESLADRLRGDEPSESLAGGDQPLVTNVSSARRTVTRLAANSADSSDSLGNTDPAEADRTRPRKTSAIS